MDLVSTKLYFRVQCYFCLHIIFSAEPVRRSEELAAASTLRIILHNMKFSVLSIAINLLVLLRPGAIKIGYTHADRHLF